MVDQVYQLTIYMNREKYCYIDTVSIMTLERAVEAFKNYCNDFPNDVMSILSENEFSLIKKQLLN